MGRATISRISWLSLAAGACLLGGTVGCSRTPAPAAVQFREGQDFAHRQRVTLSLTREAGKLRLASRTEIQVAHLSERSTDRTTYWVAEPFYAPVTGLEARLDGEPLPGGQISRVLPNREDVFISNTRLHKLRFKRIRRGQSISYSYRQRFSDLAYAPFYLVPNIDQVTRYEVTVRHPPDIRVDFELFHARGVARPVIQRSASLTRLVLAELPRHLPLAHYPFNDFNVAVWPRFSRAGEPVTPDTPAAFTGWYLGLMKEPPPLGGEQARLVEKLTAGAATTRARVKALYDFVRQEVRYIADERDLGSIVPSAPKKVLGRRYGDCKDKAYLLSAMARQLGVKVDMVLVGRRGAPPFKGVHPWLFNHVIAAMESDGGRLFMDPTCARCALGTLPEGDVGERGLLLIRGAPVQLTIPPPPHRPDLEVTITASADDPTGAAAALLLRGALLRRVVELKRTEAPDTMLGRLATRLGRLLYNIELSGLKVEAIAEGQARLTAKADLTRFITRTDRRLYLPRVPFRTVDNTLLERVDDSRPLHLKARPHLSMELRLRAPGFLPRQPSKEQFGQDGLARFEARYAPAGEVHHFSYRFQQQIKEAAGEERAALLRFCEKYLQSRRKMFSLKRAKQ